MAEEKKHDPKEKKKLTEGLLFLLGGVIIWLFIIAFSYQEVLPIPASLNNS